MYDDKGRPFSNSDAFEALLVDHTWGTNKSKDAMALVGLTLARLLDSGEANAQHYREYRECVIDMRGGVADGVFGSDLPSTPGNTSKS